MGIKDLLASVKTLDNLRDTQMKKCTELQRERAVIQEAMRND